MKLLCNSNRCSCGSLFGAFALILLSMSFPLRSANAQTISTVTPLSFGEIVIRDFSVVGRVTILSGGSYTYNGNIFLHSPPIRGEYSVVGGPGSSFFTVTLPLSVPLTGPGGPFTLDNLVVEPAINVTDASGNATFHIIGRLQTLGGGIGYSDGTYDITFPMTVSF